MRLSRQAGRNHWHVRWKADGIRHEVSTGTSDRLQAERVMSAMREAVERQGACRRVEELLRAAYPEFSPRTVRLEAAADLYRAQVEDSPRTRLVRSHWARFAAWAPAHRAGISSLQDVDAACCRAFAASLPGAPKTVANVVRNCARLWRVVAPGAGIALDPWKGIRLAGAVTRPGRALTQAELSSLLAATAGTEYGGAILAGLYTGLRYGDVARLRWDSVQGEVLALAPSKTARHGIGVRIPLHPELAAYLRGLPRAGEYVFPGLASGYARRGTARLFAKACRAAGVPHAGITYHSLRHTFVTLLAEAGTPEDVRRRLAGHSSAATHDIYSHDLEAQRAAVLALPAIRACPPSPRRARAGAARTPPAPGGRSPSRRTPGRPRGGPRSPRP